jgi:NADH:ubiquinone oxidoreductase subunit 3 (subunit A)
MKNKTAVEEFAIALYEGGYLQGNGDEIQKLLEQHLEMEKEQIIDAYECGFESEHDARIPQSSMIYYNKTYGDNK